jgi:ABC-2 type transport system ATP-binding protein
MDPVTTRAERPVIASLRGTTKTYGTTTALDNLDLAMRRGQVLGLLGPNGAGKTTAVRLLLGLTSPSRGVVSVFGGDPRDPSVRTRLGAMLQVARVPETLRVAEHLDLFRSYYPAPLPAGEALAIAGLKGLDRRLFGDLSGGQKQRVLFALALCGDPDLLFLDEPTVGMDVEARHGVWNAIRDLARRGKTVLLTTHYIEEADALSDHIAVLHRGTVIAEGTPAEIKTRTAGKRIRCRCRLDLHTVRALPGVSSAEHVNGVLEVRAAEAEKVIRELMARDEALSDIEVTAARLEEAFLALTGEPKPHTAVPDRR